MRIVKANFQAIMKERSYAECNGATPAGSSGGIESSFACIGSASQRRSSAGRGGDVVVCKAGQIS